MGLVSANSIKSVVNKLLQDSSITVDVTYKAISSTYYPETRDTLETTTEVSCDALKSEYSLREINQSGGMIKIGDVQFLIRADALSSITVRQNDKIYEGGKNWKIVNDGIRVTAIGSTEIMYSFHCR